MSTLFSALLNIHLQERMLNVRPVFFFFFFNNTHQAVNSIVTQFTWRYHGQRSLEGYSPWSHKESVEYIMRNAGLDEAQAGIKIAGRNINNLRYTDDSMLMAESEEEPKNLLMNVEEEGEKMA